MLSRTMLQRTHSLTVQARTTNHRQGNGHLCMHLIGFISSSYVPAFTYTYLVQSTLCILQPVCFIHHQIRPVDLCRDKKRRPHNRNMSHKT